MDTSAGSRGKGSLTWWYTKHTIFKLWIHCYLKVQKKNKYKNSNLGIKAFFLLLMLITCSPHHWNHTKSLAFDVNCKNIVGTMKNTVIGLTWNIGKFLLWGHRHTRDHVSKWLPNAHLQIVQSKDICAERVKIGIWMNLFSKCLKISHPAEVPEF